MKPDDANGRTHEPSLRELTADLDGLRELFEEKIRANKELMDERDKRYTERDRDRQAEVEKALTAAKEQTNAAFAASKEAITEAKKAQDSYNLTHNDLIRKMEKQASDTMPRLEAEGKLKALDEKFQELKSSLADSGGIVIGRKMVKDESRANMGIIIAFVALILSAVLGFVRASAPTSLPPINLVMPSPGVSTTTTQPVPQPLVPR